MNKYSKYFLYLFIKIYKFTFKIYFYAFIFIHFAKSTLYSYNYLFCIQYLALRFLNNLRGENKLITLANLKTKLALLFIA